MDKVIWEGTYYYDIPGSTCSKCKVYFGNKHWTGCPDDVCPDCNVDSGEYHKGWCSLIYDII